MKKILLSAWLLFGIAASAQVVTIPDPVFKNWLLSSDAQNNNIAWNENNNQIVIDANGDNEIQESEAEQVWVLNLGGAGISDATGLEAFINLRSIICHSNPTLTSLDLTSLINLEVFLCDDNTGLESLSFEGLSTLKTVFIMGTNLNTINLTGVTGLLDFTLQDVPVTNLDFSDMDNLSKIGLYGTYLTDVDLSNSHLLQEAGFEDNPLLESINVKNGDNYFEFSIENNPQLSFMCVDEGEDELLLEYFEIEQMTPPYMSTTCEFVPGQMYNKISGKIRLDLDNNGCTESDAKPSYYEVKIFDGTTEKIKYANQDGEYLAWVGAGTYTITAPYQNSLFSSMPAMASVTFAGMDNDTFLQDFCVSINEPVDDVTVTIYAPASRPGFDTDCYVYIRNNGNTIATSGTVTFNYDDSVLDYIAAMPVEGTSTSGSLTWGYSNLLPFEVRIYKVTMNVNSPTETPAVNINDVLLFSAAVTMQGNDVNLTDNTFDAESLVVGSFDPNNIICMEGSKEPVENIGKHLNYVVNFENTGNAAAEFVVISQQIDAAKFDVNSFEVINSSHPVDITRVGNNVVFRFENINLGAAEQGNVVFRIKTLASLGEGDQVMNKATMVFDYNYGLVTNEAITTFETILGSGKPVFDKSVTVYPNPAKDSININAVSDILGVELYDIQGRLVQLIKINAASAQIDLTGRQSGIYILKVATAKGVMVQKVVKQ